MVALEKAFKGYILLVASRSDEALALAQVHSGVIGLLLTAKVQFLAKPFSPTALASKIRPVLDR